MNVDQRKIERLKHDLAIKLETQKWDHRKEELQYLEAGQHQRSLNQLMWQIPSIAIAITGGLWFGATSLSEGISKSAIFCFTAGVDVLTIIIIVRLRQLIQIQMDSQIQFSQQTVLNKNGEVGSQRNFFNSWLLPNGTVIYCWGATLLLAAIISILAIKYPPSFSKSESKDVNCCVCFEKISQDEVESKIDESADQSATKRIIGPESPKPLKKSVNVNKIDPAVENSRKSLKRKRVICKS